MKVLKFIKKSLTSVVGAMILFGTGWYYLDQQRLELFQDEKKIIIQNVESKINEQDYAKRIQLLAIKEEKIQQQYEQQSRDEELSKLTLKYIDEMSGVDISYTCHDDPEHNEKVRKAKALLSLIKSKSQEYGRHDLVRTFVNEQSPFYGITSINCNKTVGNW